MQITAFLIVSPNIAHRHVKKNCHANQNPTTCVVIFVWGFEMGGSAVAQIGWNIIPLAVDECSVFGVE